MVRHRNQFADRKICGLFDIVKNSFREHTSIWLNVFANISTFAKAECFVGNRIFSDPLCAGFIPAHDGFNDQASKGHLVDALALRGDEGRSTLR